MSDDDGPVPKRQRKMSASEVQALLLESQSSRLGVDQDPPATQRPTISAANSEASLQAVGEEQDIATEFPCSQQPSSSRTAVSNITQGLAQLSCPSQRMTISMLRSHRLSPTQTTSTQTTATQTAATQITVTQTTVT